MKKYQEALDRLKSIDLDIVLDKLDYDVACDVSVYGIHDYPMLEMDRDIKTLQELIDKETPKRPYKPILENTIYCTNCGKSGLKYGQARCLKCWQVLDWTDDNE